ncbi:MAG: hypothetical protein ACFFAQ_06690 [Promethearchaeota archaeon]
MRAFHYPFVFIVLLLSFQISVYFFYRYFQIKDEKLGINKFLLAFGLLYFFGFTGIGIRTINSYYINNSLINDFLLNLSHILIFFGAFSFLMIVSQKSFNKLINTNFSKIVSIITFFLSLLILIIDNIILDGVFVIISLFLGSIFMVYFHIKLIQKSAGNVKRRILILFFGEILIIMMVVIGAEKNPYLFNPMQQQIVALIYNPLMILGQMIVFYAIYNFPIFLEFNWQDNLVKLFIIDSRRLEILYYYNFSRKGNNERKIKEDSNTLQAYNIIFPGGIVGMESIISVITKSKESKIEKVQQGENLILLDYGGENMSFLIFCILVKKEMVSMRYFLNTVKNKFNDIYKNILIELENLEGEYPQIFEDFNNDIVKILKLN